jgi:hypothetical protein
LHPAILHRKRKAILKTLAVALALWALPLLACAADLVVGVVHDSDGYPVAGATVTLRAAGGAVAGTGTTASDGTFAVDTGAVVAKVDVRCAYCAPLTVARVPDKPVVAVVRRYAALRDHGISAADAEVLPYSSVTAMAALMPFVVATRGTISDRGLDAGRGTVIADGIALYRAIDGVDLGTAIPAHATATIGQTAPAQASAYDANSSGGLFSIDTLDNSAGLARVDGSNGVDATIRGGNDLRGAAATSGGPYPASRAVLDGTVAAGGGTLDLRGVTASGMGANASGFASTFTVPVRTSTLSASLSAADSNDINGPENDEAATLSLQRGDLTFGVRAQRSNGLIAGLAAVQYDERGYLEFAHDNGTTSVFASLTEAQSGDTAYNTLSTNAALLPALSLSTHISPAFTLHADSVDSLLAAPLYLLDVLPNGTAIDRSNLIDAGIGFDDSRRFRIDAMIFRQTISGAAYGTTGGSGISTVWQVAPSLAVRSWTLISRENGDNSAAYAGVAGGAYSTGMTTLDRNVTWITAGNTLRVDAIWRSGNLEGDVSLPAGPHFRFVAGTRRDGPTRLYTAGLIWP